MAKPVSAAQIAKDLGVAVRIVDSALPLQPEGGSPVPVDVTAAARNAVLPVILRELLDNEYKDDLS